MKLKYFTLLLFFLLIFSFLKPLPTLANTYYFQDEFNEERLSNTLDPSKWSAYQNSPDTVTTIQETNGNLQMSQQNSTHQYPLIISKYALPEDNFSLDIKFQYNKVTGWGTGFALTEAAPVNGGGFLNVFTISIWQDTLPYNMRVTYGNDMSPARIVYQTSSADTNEHLFTIKYLSQKYFIYLDGQLIYNSQNTNKKIRYLWLGNPAYFNSVIPSWTSFKINYIRITTLPEPFLDLPWDYSGKGLTFNDAALAINSFFDHQYPLLSAGMVLNEPSTTNSTIVNFLGETSNEAYSKHDGYDYGRAAKANLGDWVLAAAPGTATYINSCKSCGNMIVINHGNGYQTRYMHLLKDDLITNIPNHPVTVFDRQPIGKVGFSGNVWPQGEGGTHIHFGVFQDKDGDGDFENNIPDGVTDPFGWQSGATDPWEIYPFSYLGQNRTGNRSYYLWKHPLNNQGGTLTSTGRNFSIGGYNVNFPVNATTQNLNLNIHSTPSVQISDNLVSIKPPLQVNATNTQNNNPVTQFEEHYDVSLDFSEADLSRVKPETVSFYSSTDQTTWNKEITTLTGTATASAEVDRTGQFALMAERKDTIPPVTDASLSGEQGQSLIFRSDVELSLSAEYNEGGLGIDFTGYRSNDGEWKLYTNPIIISEEGHYKIEYYSSDKDDNIEEIKVIEFDIDKTPPVITGNFSPSPNLNGWNSTDVTVHFDCLDTLSGIDSCTPDIVVSNEGDEQSVTGEAVDKAGNLASFTVTPINIDKTAPLIFLNLTPNILWPITNKATDISLISNITDDYFNKGIINITDEYNLVEPEVAEFTNPEFETVFQLLAQRQGEDTDGRTYNILLTAFDWAGNVATREAQVIVPHDKGKN